MHIFRHATQRVRVGELAQACGRAVRGGDGMEVLLAAARLECGAADVWAAAIEAERLATLRPVGPPAERRIAAGAELAAAMRAWRGAVLVVDEGPGLSGSSFGGTVRWLRGLGVEAERITLVASWNPAGREAARLSNRYTARHWPEWHVRTAAAVAAPGTGAQELSGGRWRTVLGGPAGEPVWGPHERRKYLLAGGRTIAKFGGLGEYGHKTLERARRLAEAGWGPALAAGAETAARQGWTLYQRERVRPLRRATRGWCEQAGRYLAWTAAEFRLEAEAPPTPEMEEMARINVRRLLGRDLAGAAPAGPRVGLDGRMRAVEWGEREHGGWVKFDGTDHGDDPFFPGPGDIAWDLAGIGIEFGAAAEAAVVAAYGQASGEREAALAPRLAWHRVAYSGFRAAFCRVAATQTDGADRNGFEAAAARYQAACAAALSGWRSRTQPSRRGDR